MLTRKQKELFVELCEEYPAGIPEDAWGFGPMCEAEEDSDSEGDSPSYDDPTYFSPEKCAEYG